jgi:hypothetical protein
MFPALLTHPQEALHKLHFVYCVRIMPVGCVTLYARSMQNAICAALPEDEQVIIETCRGP